jgi:ethanolamine ammonia-lyase small subunit
MSADDADTSPPARRDGWAELRRLTPARIALGRAGHGLPTQAHLAFTAAHAAARDAVHASLDVPALAGALAARGHETRVVASAAPDRATYLRRPDLGRMLAPASETLLSAPARAPDVALIVADGLSATAIAENALAVLDALVPKLAAAGLAHGPVIVATQARVALADHVGDLLQARVSVLLIGERPGLSAADSLGLYLTHAPRRGRVDAERNCISNVRAGGTRPEAAAAEAFALVEAMLAHGTSGVALSATLARAPAIG